MLCHIGNPKHPLILGSNRDEYFYRLTQSARFVTPDVLMPVDLQRSEHGTWIGINKKNGKLCVLVNYRENVYPNQLGPVSRGAITKSFLNSELNPLQWVDFIKRESNSFEKVGGFTLFFGVLIPGTDIRESLYVISNREEGVIKPFADKSRETFGLSNSFIFHPWPKVVDGEDLISKVSSDTSLTAELLADSVFNVMSLSKERDPGDDDDTYVEKTIFVPTVTRQELGSYGTRTQTVIIVTVVAEGYTVLYQERDVSDKNLLVTESFLIGGL